MLHQLIQRCRFVWLPGKTLSYLVGKSYTPHGLAPAWVMGLAHKSQVAFFRQIDGFFPVLLFFLPSFVSFQ
jgi:hypothetical protein